MGTLSPSLEDLYRVRYSLIAEQPIDRISVIISGMGVTMVVIYLLYRLER